MQTSTLPLRRLTALMTLFALLLSASLAATSASAQINIPAAALTSDAQVEQLLRQGLQMEDERRWSEAFRHYESALKSNPGRRDLQQRMTLARMHLDVVRRYNDPSFTGSLDNMSYRESLDVYSEVLLKINTFHVQNPNWSQLVRRGTMSLEVALTEPDFVNRHVPVGQRPRIDATRSELQRALQRRTITSRHQAHEAVALAAQMAGAIGVAPQAVIIEYMCGAVSSLDTYSAFLTSGQYDEIMSQIEGNFVGLGIEIKADGDALLIVNAISGGPAHRAGLRGQDRIVEVNGYTMKDISTDQAADMLKGAEGSTVDITVVSPNDNRRSMRVRRERVEVPSVEDVKIVDRDYGIGYLKLTSFQKTTVKDFNNALWQLHRQGMRSLIVDVRGNPGGLLQASVDVADKFISSGKIVLTRGRNPREDFDHQANVFGTWRVPLVVLIDGYSASASEIFAGAIKDQRRGTIVGQRSYGKGSVQGIFPLNLSKGGVRLTTAKFFSPSGQPISSRGVTPDVTVQTTAKPTANGETAPVKEEDATMNAALRVSRQRLSQR